MAGTKGVPGASAHLEVTLFFSLHFYRSGHALRLSLSIEREFPRSPYTLPSEKCPCHFDWINLPRFSNPASCFRSIDHNPFHTSSHLHLDFGLFTTMRKPTTSPGRSLCCNTTQLAVMGQTFRVISIFSVSGRRAGIPELTSQPSTDETFVV